MDFTLPKIVRNIGKIDAEGIPSDAYIPPSMMKITEQSEKHRLVDVPLLEWNQATKGAIDSTISGESTISTSIAPSTRITDRYGISSILSRSS